MKRATVCVGVALLCAVLATTARAQSEQNYEDRQHTKEYTDEDSHPLRVASYFVAPIGFLLEWTIARPLHYLAHETFLAPAMNATTEDDLPAIPRAELPPPDIISEGPTAAASTSSSTVAAPQTPVTAADAERQGLQPGTPPAEAGGGQPALH